jgi:hypothetical protein
MPGKNVFVVAARFVDSTADNPKPEKLSEVNSPISVGVDPNERVVPPFATEIAM